MRLLLNLFCLCVLLLEAATLMAQDSDSLTAEPRRYANRGRDRVIIDINTDQWVESIPGVTLKQWSPGANLYYMADYIFLNSAFSLAIGFGLGSTNFHSNASPRPASNGPAPETTDLVPFNANATYKTNKMSANYLEMPIELRLRTRRRTTWRLYGGFKVGYLVNFHTKLKDDSGKYKEYNTRYIRPYRFGPMARVGIGKINFSAFYSMSSLFEDGRGPEITPFTLGFSIFVL